MPVLSESKKFMEPDKYLNPNGMWNNSPKPVKNRPKGSIALHTLGVQVVDSL